MVGSRVKFLQRSKLALQLLTGSKSLQSGSGRFFSDSAPDGFSWYGFVPTSGATPLGASVDIVWDALNNGTVFACLDATAKAIAQLPIDVVQWDPEARQFIRPQGMNRAPAREALERLNKPNERQSQYAFIYNLVFVLRAWGNAFINAKQIGGVIPRLTLINPYRMRPITITENNVTRIVRYEFTGAGGYNEFSPAEMFQLRDCEIDAITGESLVLRNADKIRLLIQTDNYALKNFANAARISGIFKSPMLNAETDTTQRDKFLNDIRNNFKLSTKDNTAGGIFVTGDPDAELIMTETLGDPQSSQLLAFREQLITEIASSFGVPASKVGSKLEQKFNNVAAHNAGWYRDTLNAIVTNIEQTLTEILIPAEKREVLRIRFDDEAYLKGDLESQINFAQQMAATGAFTKDEVRAHLNYPPLDGNIGKELAGGTKPITGADNKPVNTNQSTKSMDTDNENL